MERECGIKATGIDEDEPRRMIERARTFIDAHLDEHLTLETIARECFLSRTVLCNRFKDATGASVGAYIRYRRMAMAADLLLDPALAIAEIARRVGYAHQGSFSEAFKQEYGCSPSTWKRERSCEP